MEEVAVFGAIDRSNTREALTEAQRMLELVTEAVLSKYSDHRFVPAAVRTINRSVDARVNDHSRWYAYTAACVRNATRAMSEVFAHPADAISIAGRLAAWLEGPDRDMQREFWRPEDRLRWP